MPSFGGEVKPSVSCRRFSAFKSILWFTWKLESTGKIDRPFLAQFRPSLTEVSHVAWRGAPLEITDGTKGGAQRASSLRPRCFGEVDLETATHIYLYLSPPSPDILRNSLPCPVGARDDFPGLKWLVHVNDGLRTPSTKVQNCTRIHPLSRTSGIPNEEPYLGFSNYDARNVLLKVTGHELSSALSPRFSSVI
jgi:hypothetical protein